MSINSTYNTLIIVYLYSEILQNNENEFIIATSNDMDGIQKYNVSKWIQKKKYRFSQSIYIKFQNKKKLIQSDSCYLGKETYNAQFLDLDASYFQRYNLKDKNKHFEMFIKL